MRNPQDISIAIADDHPWVIGGIKTIIADNTNYKVIATATDGKQLLHLLNSHFVDLILLDLNLPEVSGLDAAEIIKQRFPDVKIIVITTYEDSKIINTLRKIGVEGYLPKSSGAPELLQALQRVIQGETIYFEKKKEPPVKTIIRDPFADKFKLTLREIEIMKLIGANASTREIADKLFISEFTVETHRKNIKHKIGFSDPLNINSFLNSH